MRECKENYFILNDEIKSTNEFQSKYVEDGKVLYEVIRIIDGIPLFLEKHLNRLKKTASLTNSTLWLDNKTIEKQIYKLISKNQVNCGNIKIIFNFGRENNFLIYFLCHSYPTPKMYKEGVPVIIYKGERINPNAKVMDFKFRSKVNKDIKDAKAYEAILVDRNGYVTEGSKSNIFMIKDKNVITSPANDVLLGVTREVIMEICKESNIEVLLKRVHYSKIKDLDALFISGTSPKVLPISFVDKNKFNSSENEILKLIMDKYNSKVEDYILEKSNSINKD